MTLILPAFLILSAGVGGYAIAYAQTNEDRADADWAWRVVDIARDRVARTTARLSHAKARPVWLPEPTRAGGRFVARHPDDPRRRMDAADRQWRENARKRAGQ